MIRIRKAGAGQTYSMFFLKATGLLWTELAMRIGRKKKLTVDSRQSTAKTGHVSSTADASLELSTVDCQLSTDSGFTLLELMIVMTIILILASMVTPTYHIAIVRAREATLRDDLYTMRNLIDQYTLDKQHPPGALQDLVDDGYLHGGLPVDPFTQSNETWHVDLEDVPLSPTQTAVGIVDVHSGSDEISSDGVTAYSSW
jgi:general secretion pathway protein G